jgi:hypothetical protein
MLEAVLDRTRDLFTDDDAHAPADERVLHPGNDDVQIVELAGAHDDRILEARARDALLETLAIGFGVGELQGIDRDQVREVLGVVASIEERFEPLRRAHPEMVGALRADIQVFLEILLVDELRAARALDPEALGDPAWLFGGRRRDWLPGLLEPGHERPA